MDGICRISGLQRSRKARFEVRTLGIFGYPPDGNETGIPPDVASPFSLKEDGTMAIRMSETQREFEQGSLIALDANDIRGLFWTSTSTARH